MAPSAAPAGILGCVAILEDVRTGVKTYLAARHLVGRSKACHLQIARPDVSGVHAEIVWDGEGWRIQDLGSRNGTFIDGRKLAVGETAALASGCLLTFGIPAHRYRMVEDGPPILMALPNAGEIALSEDGMLSLPALEACEISIYVGGTGEWLAEGSDRTWVVEDQEILVAGGQSWRICLPSRHHRTTEGQSGPALAPLGLEFSVSRDGEHIAMRLVDGGSVHEVEARAHLALMLQLARCRLADARNGDLPPSEHGWVHREDLRKQLGIDQPLLNLWVHRSRQQLARIRPAHGVIERRAGSQQIRIGFDRLRIEHA